jgi:RNA-directed DNA polymerase
VRANKGSAGIDEISMKEFDANKRRHLYKLWNRMASGSYFPPPVKELEIAKKDGNIRKLGMPTISDRIGQMVVKMFIEPRLEREYSVQILTVIAQREMPIRHYQRHEKTVGNTTG